MSNTPPRNFKPKFPPVGLTPQHIFSNEYLHIISISLPTLWFPNIKSLRYHTVCGCVGHTVGKCVGLVEQWDSSRFFILGAGSDGMSGENPVVNPCGLREGGFHGGGSLPEGFFRELQRWGYYSLEKIGTSKKCLGVTCFTRLEGGLNHDNS